MSKIKVRQRLLTHHVHKNLREKIRNSEIRWWTLSTSLFFQLCSFPGPIKAATLLRVSTCAVQKPSLNLRSCGADGSQMKTLMVLVRFEQSGPSAEHTQTASSLLDPRVSSKQSCCCSCQRSHDQQTSRSLCLPSVSTLFDTRVESEHH